METKLNDDLKFTVSDGDFVIEAELTSQQALDLGENLLRRGMRAIYREEKARFFQEIGAGTDNEEQHVG